MTVYKKRTYWAIYIYLVILITVLALVPFFVPPNAFSYHPVMLLFIALQVIILLFIQFSRAKQEVLISDNSILSKSLFASRELKFNEIKGFNRLHWYSKDYIMSHVVINSNTDLKKGIKIDLSYENSAKLVEWIESNFNDLDKENIAQEKAEILNDPIFGSNPIKRALKIKQSKTVANTLNIIATIAFGFTAFPFRTSNYAIIASILIPILAIIAIIYFKGLIRLQYTNRLPTLLKQSKKNPHKIESTNPSIFTDVSIAIMLSSFGLVVAAIRKFQILDYTNVWIPAFGISALILLIIAFITKEFQFNKLKTYGNIIFFFIMLYGYGFGTIVSLNCLLDNVEPTMHTSKVLRKDAEQGSKKSLIPSKSYKLIISSWKESTTKSHRIKVSKKLYQSVNLNEALNISERKGAFDISWFTVSK